MLEGDTSSRRTVMSLGDFKKNKIADIRSLKQDEVLLRDYTQNIFKLLGYCVVRVQFKDRVINGKPVSYTHLTLPTIYSV